MTATLLLNENAPIDAMLDVLFLLVAGPLYIWLMASLLSNKPKTRDKAMLIAGGLAVFGWIGSLGGLLSSGVYYFFLFSPLVVCLFRLRAASNKTPRP